MFLKLYPEKFLNGKEFTWTPWESGTFMQGNVRVSQNGDCTMDLAMDHYVKDLEPIPLNPQRRRELENYSTENERTQLCRLLSELQCKAQQQGPEYSA